VHGQMAMRKASRFYSDGAGQTVLESGAVSFPISECGKFRSRPGALKQSRTTAVDAGDLGQGGTTRVLGKTKICRHCAVCLPGRTHTSVVITRCLPCQGLSFAFEVHSGLTLRNETSRPVVPAAVRPLPRSCRSWDLQPARPRMLDRKTESD